MKSARNQFVLLGLICQGMSWDTYIICGIYAFLWLLCLTVPRKPIRLGALGESVLLLTGVTVGVYFASTTGQSTHFAVGNGLALIQLDRLLRPLSAREKKLSLIIAMFHLGVACAVILDIRFTWILLASIWLVPRALAELEAAEYASSNGAASPDPGYAQRPAISASATGFVLALTVAVFLFMPRSYVGTPLRGMLGRSSGQPTLLDSIVDPARSGVAQSHQILLQIQGEQIGYLRCLALTDFENDVWQTSSYQPMWRIRSTENPGYALQRKVRIKNTAFLGRVLPADGRVVQVPGVAYRGLRENLDGLIETVDTGWNRGDYEYWIDPRPEPSPISDSWRHFLTIHPAPSARVNRWLDDTLGGVTNQLDQARLLESYFREHFTYKLGAPELNREYELEDFLFNRREGHCERFASALALLLRMRNIPTRVLVGYVPTSRNWVSGWYDVRFSDAHAWTEAWFPRYGWVSLDATPRANAPPVESGFTDFFESLDFAWYAHVVNFDASSQSGLFSALSQGLTRLPNSILELVPVPVITVLTSAICGVVILLWLRSRTAMKKTPTQQQRAAIIAGQYYGRMQRSLARLGHQRLPHQTPWEFAESLAAFPAAKDIQLVTRFFCATRYGNRVIEPQEKLDLEKALADIEKPPSA